MAQVKNAGNNVLASDTIDTRVANQKKSVFTTSSGKIDNSFLDIGNPVYFSTSVTGTDTLVATSSAGAYTQGMQVIFQVPSNNTGATTINVNSLGAKKIVKQDNQELEAEDLLAGYICKIVYDGTNFRLLNIPHSPEFRFT